MKKLIQFFAVCFVVVVLFNGKVFAQAQGRPDFANMDPQQIQQMMQRRMLESFRDQLAVTNDAEWGVIEGRLTKVARMKMESMFSAGMGMMGGMRRGGGDNGPAGGGFRGFAGLFPSDPDVEILQKAIESNAPSAQIQSALAKLREARKQKQAELAKAQADLRSVLTTRQEAALVVAGMLD